MSKPSRIRDIHDPDFGLPYRNKIAMSDHNTARVAAEAAGSGLEVGWRVMVKMGEKRVGKVRWELVVRPPGMAGERVVRMVSSFETEVGPKREEWARGLLGCVERLLDRVAPGGLGR